jgi:gas vesicle protein
MDERNPSRRGKEDSGDTGGSPGRGERPRAEPGEAGGTGGGGMRETARESVKELGDEAKETARRQGSRMKEKGREGAEKAKEAGREVLSEARERTGEVADEARTRVNRMAEERKSQAADTLERVSHALRSASDSLREEEADGLGRYGERAAGQVERFSSYIRENDLDSMISSAEDFARRRPEIFYGGMLLGGVIAGRFLRSSSSSPGRSRESRARSRTLATGSPRSDRSGGVRGQLPRSSSSEVGDGVAGGVGRHNPLGGGR